MSLPAPLHSVMTDAEYEAARQELRATYGDTRAEAGARFEQELARLFYRSGWTQEKLAEKEGKSQQRITELLRFGRFLDFTARAVKSENLPSRFTEKAFRRYWQRTPKGDERDRFRAVLRLIEENPPGKKINVASELIKQFGDGKWHKVDAIAEQLEVPREEIEHTLNLMVTKPKNYKARCERRELGKEARFFPMDQTISLKELIEKLRPIVNGLKAEGRKNMATMSPNTVAYLAGKLEKLLDEWAE